MVKALHGFYQCSFHYKDWETKKLNKQTNSDPNNEEFFNFFNSNLALKKYHKG